MFALILMMVTFAQVRFEPNAIDTHWIGIPLPPCFVNAGACYGHELGTDEIGRDILARLTHGGLVSLGLALIAAVLTLVFGIIAGMISRFGGSIPRFIVQRFAAAVSCFPPWAFMLVMIAIGTTGPRSIVSAFVVATLAALLLWPRVSEIVSVASDAHSTVAVLLNQVVLDWTQMIALFATIDFVGLGIQPPTPSWGNMLHNFGENVTIAWWAAVFPPLCLCGAILVIEILRRLLFAQVGSPSKREQLLNQLNY